MTKYTPTPDGFLNHDTGLVEPFNRDAPVCLPQIMRSDDTPPLRSMADGKIYTSKAAMRESYKAANNPRGKEFVEVGNETQYLTPNHKPKTADKEDIALAVTKAEAAVSRGEFDHIT